MEDVWKEITRSCNLHNEIPTTPPIHHHHHHLLPRTNIVLQDFLAGSPFRDQVVPPSHHLLPQNPIDLNQLDSASKLDPSAHLISICPKKRLLGPDHHQQQQQQMMMTMNVDRFGINVNISDDERRHRRMIKNRESAARSRARKQSCTNELELEVAHLVQENAKLRRQCEELKSAMAAQNPAKKAIQRASSASF